MSNDTMCKLVALFVGGPALIGYACYALFVAVPLAILVGAAVSGG